MSTKKDLFRPRDEKLVGSFVLAAKAAVAATSWRDSYAVIIFAEAAEYEWPSGTREKLISPRRGFCFSNE